MPDQYIVACYSWGKTLTIDNATLGFGCPSWAPTMEARFFDSAGPYTYYLR